jgi:hypothetical protein
MFKKIERKSIPNYPGYYADRRGRIWKKFYGQWRIIKPVTHHDGFQYTYVGDNNNRRLTQRLVCSAFKGECSQKLPLCIRKAKRQQPRRVRSQRYLKWGKYNDKVKRGGYHHLTNEQRLEIIKLNKNGRTQISLSKQFGVSQPAISFIVNGKTKVITK